METNSTIFKVHKTDNFTVMNNNHLRNKSLKNKEKGLLSVMLSLPPNWNYSINGLAKLSSDGKDAIVSQLKGLQKAGYVLLESDRTEKGFFQTIYHIFEEPQNRISENSIELGVLSDTENPNRKIRYGKSDTENPPQLITNNKELIVNTKKDKNIIEKETFGEFSNVHLFAVEVDKLKNIYKSDDDLNSAIEILSSYKESSGKKYKSDYAVLGKHNWVYAKLYKVVKHKNKKEDIAQSIPNYEGNSKW